MRYPCSVLQAQLNLFRLPQPPYQWHFPPKVLTDSACEIQVEVVCVCLSVCVLIMAMEGVKQSQLNK